jgi:hypothetical protein
MEGKDRGHTISMEEGTERDQQEKRQGGPHVQVGALKAHPDAAPGSKTVFDKKRQHPGWMVAMSARSAKWRNVS